SDLAIKLFGDDFDELKKTAQKLQSVLESIDGHADVGTEQLSGQPVLQIQVQQDKVARYGIPVRTLMELVQSLAGRPVGEVMEGQLRFPLAVRLPEKEIGRASCRERV